MNKLVSLTLESEDFVVVADIERVCSEKQGLRRLQATLAHVERCYSIREKIQVPYPSIAYIWDKKATIPYESQVSRAFKEWLP